MQVTNNLPNWLHGKLAGFSFKPVGIKSALLVRRAKMVAAALNDLCSIRTNTTAGEVASSISGIKAS